MLILILINVKYLQNVVLALKKVFLAFKITSGQIPITRQNP